MKNTLLKPITGTALALLILIGGGHVSAFGQEEEKSEQVEESRARQHSLVGVWAAQVTLRNCTTGAPVGGFRNQLTFARGGTLLETIAPTIFRSDGNGLWKREHGRNEFSFAHRFMRFDSAGAFVGSGVVRVLVTLDETGDSYSATATNDVIDVNGNIIASGCATAVATRFQP